VSAIDLPRARRLAFGVVLGQAVVSGIAALCAGALAGRVAALSALIGGGIATAGSLAMAGLVFGGAAKGGAQRVVGAFYVGEAGSASTDKALTKLFTTQLSQAGTRSLPLTLVILLLVFGSLLAAWIPLMLGLQAVIATMGITNIISHITPLDPNVQSVVLLIGLAVGVDYTLFYLRREREERAAGRSERAALEAAAATSGRSVLVSGITVMIAMA